MTRRVYSSILSCFPAKAKFKRMPRYVGYGRKRKRGRYSAAYKRKRMMVPYSKRGYLRTAGFYGRFAGRGAELKFLDGQLTNQSITATGTFLFTTHNIVAQGNSQSERIGRKITIRSIRVKGTIKMFAQDQIGDMEQRVRILFVVDSQANGAAPTIDEVLNFAGVLGINSFRDLANVRRYRVIYDRVFDLPVMGVAADGISTFLNIPTSKGWGFSKKMHLPIEYDSSSTTGSLSTQRSNNIFSFAIAENTNESPFVSFVFRIRYSDAG